MKRDAYFRWTAVLAAACLALVVLIGIAYSINSEERMARIKAHSYIEEHLGEVKFGRQKRKDCVKSLGDRKFYVRGWFECDDEFGRPQRCAFECRMEHRGVNAWKCENMSFRRERRKR